MMISELQRSAVHVEIDAHRDQVGEIPARGLEVVDLGSVIGAESQIQPTRSAMQHLPATPGRESPVRVGGMWCARKGADLGALCRRKTEGAECPAAVIELECQRE